MMDRRLSNDPRATAIFGWAAFIWRLILTTGTGSIFGFLIARDAVSGAIMAPIFIASSLLYGLAFTVLVLLTMSIETSDILCTKELIGKFRGLLALFAATTLALTLIAHLTKLYAAPTDGRRTVPAARRRHFSDRLLDRPDRARPAGAAVCCSP